MEKADVLYGVTMQERGVTKLVSVRMENVSDYMDDEKWWSDDKKYGRVTISSNLY